MKQSFLILALILSFSGQVWAQDSLDFLDKVNEKPKTTTPATTTKPKEETTPVVGKKSNQQQVTTSTKKRKSKKKNASALVNQNGTGVTNPSVTPATVATVNTISNPITAPEPKVPVENQAVVEEETTVAGLWLDPQVAVEPVGLPGFGGDVSIGKVSVEDGKVGTSAGIATTVPSKPLFSFSEFFDKYKKAMLILGVIVLFAFYRLRMTKSSSGSRPYRR